MIYEVPLVFNFFSVQYFIDVAGSVHIGEYPCYNP